MRLPKFSNKMADALNWMVTISNSIGDKLPSEVKERLPGFMGLSLADEQLFAEKTGQLNASDKESIVNFLESIEKYESNRFRNVVAGITKIVKKPDNKEEDIDAGVLYLEKLAKVIQGPKGVNEAKRQCVAENVIVIEPLWQKISIILFWTFKNPFKTLLWITFIALLFFTILKKLFS